MTWQTLLLVIIVSRLQSYNIILYVVSVAYGKSINKAKKENAKNQPITNNSTQNTMEKFYLFEKMLPLFFLFLGTPHSKRRKLPVAKALRPV